MAKYVFMAKAAWTEGGEHPFGHADWHEAKTRRLKKIFDADSDQAARATARVLMMEFKKKLPKRHDGSLTWNDKPKIEYRYLSRVIHQWVKNHKTAQP